jgi:hypothetical protein
MRVIFLFTHLGAGGSLLCQTLVQNPRITTLGHSRINYDHPSCLNLLRERIITINGKLYPGANIDKGRLYPGAYLMDEILHNHEFSCFSLLEESYNIILFRSPEASLQEIITKHQRHPVSAQDYYFFRLRRLCELANRMKRKFVVRYEDLGKQEIYDDLASFLDLNFNFSPSEVKQEDIKIEISNKLKYKFDKYALFLKSQ